MTIDWSDMSPDDIARALATIPKLVAYAWKESDDGSWVRHDVVEYGDAEATRIRPIGDGGFEVFLGLRGWTGFIDVEIAKAAADERLRTFGWILSDVEAPPHL